MAAEVESYPLDQLFNKIRKKKIPYSMEFQSPARENLEPINELKQELKQELNAKLKSIRNSLENND